MANYEKILELRPELADFIRLRKSLRYRGEVMGYPANLSCESFSTDRAGYRHSTFRGETLGVAECIASESHGIILGASNNFGFGIAGNENTMASMLAERFGFPVANAALPGGNSRNLFTLLIAFLARAAAQPSVIIFSSGGDLGSFCESSLADAVFGPPNRGQISGPLKQARVESDPEVHLAPFLRFTALWTTSIGNLCRAYGIPFVIIHQSTFFDKAAATATEREFGLGETFRASDEQQMANFKKFSGEFYARRKEVADQLGVPLAGLGLSDRLSFLDEYHLDRDGMRTLSDAVGDAAEPLIKSR